MIRLFRKLLIVLAFITIPLAGVSYFQCQIFLTSPYGIKQTIRFNVSKGQTLKPVLEKLESLGALQHASALYFYARIKEIGRIQHGNYEFETPKSPLEILELLEKGAIELTRFTVPEGLNRWQIRTILVDGGWLSKDTFDLLCDDKDFLTTANIPGPTCDGYLFPETYIFASGVSPKTIFETMFSLYKKTYVEIAQNFRPPISLNQLELTTLASIIEKETGSSGERARIACVFYNRMLAKPSWRLETDPTVIYAATLSDPHFDGNLKREHLRSLNNPYNTYMHKGLPPGPIASPGKKALQAAFQPETCPYYFFVSKNNGAHQFCETLDCHNTNVKKWQVDYFKPLAQKKTKAIPKRNKLLK